MPDLPPVSVRPTEAPTISPGLAGASARGVEAAAKGQQVLGHIYEIAKQEKHMADRLAAENAAYDGFTQFSKQSDEIDKSGQVPTTALMDTYRETGEKIRQDLIKRLSPMGQQALYYGLNEYDQRAFGHLAKLQTARDAKMHLELETGMSTSLQRVVADHAQGNLDFEPARQAIDKIERASAPIMNERTRKMVTDARSELPFAQDRVNTDAFVNNYYSDPAGFTKKYLDRGATQDQIQAHLQSAENLIGLAHTRKQWAREEQKFNHGKGVDVLANSLYAQAWDDPQASRDALNTFAKSGDLSDGLKQTFKDFGIDPTVIGRLSRDEIGAMQTHIESIVTAKRKGDLETDSAAVADYRYSLSLVDDERDLPNSTEIMNGMKQGEYSGKAAQTMLRDLTSTRKSLRTKTDAHFREVYRAGDKQMRTRLVGTGGLFDRLDKRFQQAYASATVDFRKKLTAELKDNPSLSAIEAEEMGQDISMRYLLQLGAEDFQQMDMRRVATARRLGREAIVANPNMSKDEKRYYLDALEQFDAWRSVLPADEYAKRLKQLDEAETNPAPSNTPSKGGTSKTPRSSGGE